MFSMTYLCSPGPGATLNYRHGFSQQSYKQANYSPLVYEETEVFTFYEIKFRLFCLQNVCCSLLHFHPLTYFRSAVKYTWGIHDMK